MVTKRVLMIENKSKNIYVEKDVVIGKNVKLFENVHLLGKTIIGDGSTVYPNTIISDSIIGKSCVIKSSVVEESELGDGVSVGPFAHIRPNSKIENDCRIGNFVEIKASHIGTKTKVSHLAYVGDAEVGANCNVGCGVIFANYNGQTKSQIIVGDNCFIGSNSNIIAPVTIASGTYICAGTTLTKSTKEDDFVIARARETIKENRAHRYLKR